jgi:DNA modification methylase
MTLKNDAKKTTRIKRERKRIPKNTFDPRNELNDLTGTEWIKLTKSVWFSTPPPRDELKEQHPATFAESDIEQLILFFTKKQQKVLDPFVGVGSTLIAAYNTERNAVGIELIKKWVDIAKKRLDSVRAQRRLDQLETPTKQEIIHGDVREVLRQLKEEEFDFIVTSPPYWKILTKKADHKTKRERLSKGLPTKYSEDNLDLGNIPKYEEFLEELKKVWAECYRVLRRGKYMCVVVTDFRHKGQYVLYHADIAKIMQDVGFKLKGMIVLVQNNKTLYPYGYPFEFVPNVHHENVMVFRKE